MDCAVEVPVYNLLKAAPITRQALWAQRLVKPEMVHKCVKERRYCHLPVSPSRYAMPTRHAARIAWLMKMGWHDPIVIDVGVPELPQFGPPPRWIIQDGNHRFYAAVMLGHETIRAEVSGSVNHAKRLLGIQI
jgi:hypothetical protein